MSAWWAGIRHVNRAPLILAGVWALTLVVSLPPAIAMRGVLARHLGPSVEAETAATGVNYDWMQEFSSQSADVGVTFRPTIIGFAAVLANLSAFLDNMPRPGVVIGSASVYIVLWLFLAGGIVDRYARHGANAASGFFSACGAFFFRFLRLGVVQGVVYACIFGVIQPALFEGLYPLLTRDLPAERTAFVVRLLCYLVFGILVAAATMVFDYARVRTVVEDRRSMLDAISAALAFLRGHLSEALALFLANFALFAAVIALYGVVAPEAGGPGIRMWIGFAVSQMYLLARLWVKLVFWASETALFQSRVLNPEAARP